MFSMYYNLTIRFLRQFVEKLLTFRDRMAGVAVANKVATLANISKPISNSSKLLAVASLNKVKTQENISTQ